MLKKRRKKRKTELIKSENEKKKMILRKVKTELRKIWKGKFVPLYFARIHISHFLLYAYSF